MSQRLYRWYWTISQSVYVEGQNTKWTYPPKSGGCSADYCYSLLPIQCSAYCPGTAISALLSWLHPYSCPVSSKGKDRCHWEDRNELWPEYCCGATHRAYPQQYTMGNNAGACSVLYSFSHIRYVNYCLVQAETVDAQWAIRRWISSDNAQPGQQRSG